MKLLRNSCIRKCNHWETLIIQNETALSTEKILNQCITVRHWTARYPFVQSSAVFLCTFFACITLFMAHLFSFCFMLQLLHVALFLCVALISCSTFSVFHFFILHSFQVALFWCCTLFMLHLFVCCTLFMLSLFSCCFMLHFFCVALFLYWTLFKFHFFLLYTFRVALSRVVLFSFFTIFE